MRLIALADARPALTARVRQVLASAAEGRFDAANFTAAGAEQMQPFFAELRQLMLGAVGPIRSIELVAESANSAGLARKYRIRFEDHVTYWTLESDVSGHIASLTPVSESDGLEAPG